MLFPLWWVLGLADVIWIITAAVMAVFLAYRGSVRVPRVFALWAVFLAFMLASVVRLQDTGGSLTVFVYRVGLYLAGTVMFVYVFNGDKRLRERVVPVSLTVYWVATSLFGYLGVVTPRGVLRTPLYYVINAASASIANNDLVNHMVVRRFAQVSNGTYLDVAPRPSAPFLFTNNWGSVYSLLLPVVIAFLIVARRRGLRWWLLLVILPISAVPALLTLNRGMFIGLGIAGVYISLRLAARGNYRGVIVVGLVAGLGFALFQALPVQERLDTRLQGDGTSTRASLYQQSLDLVPGSPIFGYGVPVKSDIPNEPDVGTQGQFWLILVSHGPVALAAFIGFFLGVVALSLRRRDPMGLALNSLLLVSVVELLYYGVTPYALPIMVAAAGVLCARPSRADDGNVRGQREVVLPKSLR